MNKSINLPWTNGALYRECNTVNMHIEWYKCLYDISYSNITTRDIGSCINTDIDMIWMCFYWIHVFEFWIMCNFVFKNILVINALTSVYVVPIDMWLFPDFIQFILSKLKTIKYLTESDKVYKKNLQKKWSSKSYSKQTW